ncbi:fimbrial protein [Franconibacter helveticus]|uniref:fimbrial protein n=1 Tax=Franconibacter helveticus TaxID=357240 RepID=UPI00066C6D25|nr:fimbrial protein [Franconibacter helveticus]
MRFLWVLCFGLISLHSYAACDKSGYLSTTLDFGKVIVQRDTPVGAVLAQKDIGFPAGTLLLTCYTSGTSHYSMTYGTAIPGYDKTYTTNLAGIGIKIWDSGGIYVTSPPSTLNWAGAQYVYIYSGRTYTVQLIKVGGVTSGPLNAGQIFYAYPEQNTSDVYTEIFMSGTSSIEQVACTLKTPSLNFPIGDILASQFGTTVGTIPAGGQNTQNLGLDCDAEANINVSLSGTQNPDVTTDSVLALTGQGNSDVAKGVGVQLLYNNTPLKLNNNIVLKKSTGGQETFPIVARYYQTKTSVTTGKANASATLNLTYQ